MTTRQRPLELHELAPFSGACVETDQCAIYETGPSARFGCLTDRVSSLCLTSCLGPSLQLLHSQQKCRGILRALWQCCCPGLTVNRPDPPVR